MPRVLAITGVLSFVFLTACSATEYELTPIDPTLLPPSLDEVVIEDPSTPPPLQVDVIANVTHGEQVDTVPTNLPGNWGAYPLESGEFILVDKAESTLPEPVVQDVESRLSNLRSASENESEILNDMAIRTAWLTDSADRLSEHTGWHVVIVQEGMYSNESQKTYSYWVDNEPAGGNTTFSGHTSMDEAEREAHTWVENSGDSKYIVVVSKTVKSGE